MVLVTVSEGNLNVWRDGELIAQIELTPSMSNRLIADLALNALGDIRCDVNG